MLLSIVVVVILLSGSLVTFGGHIFWIQEKHNYANH